MNAKSILSAIGRALPAFLAAVPVTAQVKFAPAGNHSFASRDKLFTGSFMSYYTMADTRSAERDISSLPLPSSLPVSTMYTMRVNGEKDATDPVIRNENGLVAENVRIGFKRTSFVYPVNPGKDIGVAFYAPEKLMLYALSLKQYAKKKGYDTTYAFLVNMGMLNSKKRLFIVNLVSMQIEQSGFVAQGRGMGTSRFDKQYSNRKDSRCTSLGRYRIMKKYKGEYGIAYKMLGLDSTNCNAYKRNIVLHSMGCMPDVEGSMPVCISEGCPAVSDKFLSSLSKIIDSRKKPVLLWIFDSNLEEIVVEETVVPKEKQWAEEKIYHKCRLHLPGQQNEN